MGEDTGNHRRLNDGGDDLQGAATLRAVFEIDIEDALEQARPAHARGRRLRMGMIGRLAGYVLCGCRNDRRAPLGVRGEYAVE